MWASCTVCQCYSVHCTGANYTSTGVLYPTVTCTYTCTCIMAREMSGSHKKKKHSRKIRITVGIIKINNTCIVQCMLCKCTCTYIHVHVYRWLILATWTTSNMFYSMYMCTYIHVHTEYTSVTHVRACTVLHFTCTLGLLWPGPNVLILFILHLL